MSNFVKNHVQSQETLTHCGELRSSISPRKFKSYAPAQLLQGNPTE